MITKEELNAIKEEIENVKSKLAELDEDELKEVTGGVNKSTNPDELWFEGVDVDKIAFK